MLVKLLRDVIEGETRNAVGEVVKEGQVKRSVRTGRPTVEWIKGTVVEMSEASGRKYVAAGVGEQVKAREVKAK